MLKPSEFEVTVFVSKIGLKPRLSVATDEDVTVPVSKFARLEKIEIVEDSAGAKLETVTCPDGLIVDVAESLELTALQA